MPTLESDLTSFSYLVGQHIYMPIYQAKMGLNCKDKQCLKSLKKQTRYQKYNFSSSIS